MNHYRPFKGISERRREAEIRKHYLCGIAGLVLIAMTLFLLIFTWVSVERRETQRIVKIYDSLPALEQAAKEATK